ncbi:KH domain-containing protein At2g38610-like isoform X2 [Macadamia integrifolia]|nr:KH domain-containing protein At2g38610-like isoform X2 [Macadamia integrifolia]
MEILPICSRLLNLEIGKVSAMIRDSSQHGSPRPMTSSNLMPNVIGTDLNIRNDLQHQGLGGLQGMSRSWRGVPVSPNIHIVTKYVSVEIPLDRYPNYNLVGWLLGNDCSALKQLEAFTGCRLHLRGRGSIRNPWEEERLRRLPGCEHLNDPFHVLVEAEFPINVVDSRLRRAVEIVQDRLRPPVNAAAGSGRGRGRGRGQGRGQGQGQGQGQGPGRMRGQE